MSVLVVVKNVLTITKPQVHSRRDGGKQSKLHREEDNKSFGERAEARRRGESCSRLQRRTEDYLNYFLCQ